MAHVTRRPSPLLLALGLSLGMLFLADRPPCDGFDSKNMDTSVSPCTDFFEYAAGAWERRTSIPPSYSQYGVRNVSTRMRHSRSEFTVQRHA